MLHDIKNIFKQSAIYGLSRISAKIISVILLPVITLYLSTDEFGIYVRIDSLWQILWAIYLFGLENGVIRWLHLFQDINEKKKFLFTVSVFLFITNAIYTLIIYISSGIISKIIFETNIYSSFIIYASLISTVETFLFIIFLRIRIQERALLYLIFSILVSILSFIFQYYYLVYTTNKLGGIFIAKVLAPAIVIIFLLPYYFKSLKFGLYLNTLKELMIFSAPVMLGLLVWTLLNQIDKYILGYLTNSSIVGIYGLAYYICGVTGVLIIAPFTLAFSVISWKKYKDENASRFFTKTITYLYFSILYLVIVLSLFTPNVITYITSNPGYWLAGNVVPWIGFAMPLYGIQWVGYFSYLASKKTNFILIFNTVALVSNIVLNFILIPYMSYYGAAIANFLSFFLLVSLTNIFSKKHFYFKYEWLKIFEMNVIALVLIIPFFVINFDSIYFEIILKFIALALFPVLLYFFRFYERIEIESLKSIFREYTSIIYKR